MTSRLRHPRPFRATAKELLGCVALFLALPLMASDGPVVTNREYSGVAKITFTGTSTLHDFEGQVSSRLFALRIQSNTWSATADVLSGSMTTANDSRDRNMWKMLGTNVFPQIKGVIREAIIPSSDTGTAAASMTLGIRDRRQDIPVTFSNWSESEGILRFKADWNVSLRQYNLNPPSVMGVIRVGDKVRLHAEVVATNVLARSLTNPPFKHD